MTNDHLIDHRLYQKENRPVAFSGKTMEKVRELISRYPEGREKSALLPVLHIAQEELGGYLSVDVMDYVASLLKIRPIEVYEVATFYTMFHLEKTGKYVIEVCRTNPCAMCGGESVTRYLENKLGIAPGQTTPDGMFTLREVECLGACGYAPVMQVNTEFHEFLTPEKIDRLIDELRTMANEDKAGESRWAESFS